MRIFIWISCKSIREFKIYKVFPRADLLPAVNGEGSNELTPRQWREGLRTHHLLPLPVSAQPAGPVLGPLPLPQSGSGLSFLEATFWSSYGHAERRGMWTPYGVAYPNG